MAQSCPAAAAYSLHLPLQHCGDKVLRILQVRREDKRREDKRREDERREDKIKEEERREKRRREEIEQME